LSSDTISLNPVRARLVGRAQEWRRSSVRAYLSGRDDGVTTLAPVLERFAPFRAFLQESPDCDAVERLRAAESIGRPLGSKAFVARLEKLSGRTLRPAKRGPKPRRSDPAKGRPI
jgi:putative transposase